MEASHRSDPDLSRAADRTYPVHSRHQQPGAGQIPAKIGLNHARVGIVGILGCRVTDPGITYTRLGNLQQERKVNL
jgi:hypothetical protein